MGEYRAVGNVMRAVPHRPGIELTLRDAAFLPILGDLIKTAARTTFDDDWQEFLPSNRGEILQGG